MRPKPSFMLRLGHSLPKFTAGLLTCLCFLSLSLPGAAGELPTDEPPPATTAGTNAPAPVTPALEEALRQLKEQQASTFQALDLIRHQTESALQQNTSVLSNQLAQFGTALATNSAIQLKFMRDTEWRTLLVTMVILLAVLLGVGALVLVAARTFNSLAKRLPLPTPAPTPTPAPSRPELAPGRVERPVALLEQAAASAYTAALLEVETRIAALERRPVPNPSTSPAAAAPARQNAPVQSKPSLPSLPTKQASSSSLALALGDGQALVFLPCENKTDGGHFGALLHRLSRLFTPRKSAAPAKPLPGPRPVKC